jgi:hypothetical protein
MYWNDKECRLNRNKIVLRKSADQHQSFERPNVLVAGSRLFRPAAGSNSHKRKRAPEPG